MQNHQIILSRAAMTQLQYFTTTRHQKPLPWQSWSQSLWLGVRIAELSAATQGKPWRACPARLASFGVHPVKFLIAICGPLALCPRVFPNSPNSFMHFFELFLLGLQKHSRDTDSQNVDSWIIPGPASHAKNHTVSILASQSSSPGQAKWVSHGAKCMGAQFSFVVPDVAWKSGGPRVFHPIHKCGRCDFWGRSQRLRTGRLVWTCGRNMNLWSTLSHQGLKFQKTLVTNEQSRS